jgi:very-short-patch-repair endonuclease
MPKYTQEIINTIREHKQNATPAELLLISKLRFRNIRFCFQHPVLTEHSFFTCDFYIPRHGLIIEVDGGCHNSDELKRKDFIKDLVYESLGYHVLRIKNSEVDTFDTLRIKNYIKGRVRLYEEPEKTPNYSKDRAKAKTKIKRNANSRSN